MMPSMLLIAAAFIFLFIPEERKSTLRERPPAALWEEIHAGKLFVSTHRVIHEVKNHRDELVLIDTRKKAEYDRFSLPGAVHMPLEEILHRRWRPLFNKDPRPKVFFGNGSSYATMAYMTAARAGYDRVFILDGGLNKLFNDLFTETEMPDTTAYNLQDRSTARFLNEARRFFLDGGVAAREEEERPRIKAPEESEIIPVIGGC